MVVPKQAAILCGGLGTRLRPLTDTVPKPMVAINGSPFLSYLLEQLKENGISEVVLLTGYLGDQIHDYFKGGGSLGIGIRYSCGPVEWETGRRLFEAKELLDEYFMLMYGDNFLPFNLKRVVKFYNEKKRLLSFIVHPKERGNIRMGEGGIVQVYDKSRSAESLDFVELGYMVVNKKVFEFYTNKDVSFSDIINKLVSKGQVVGYTVLDIYVCPHHWDEKCFCRKPEPGSFFEASQKWSFRLDKTYFIGDDPRDCQAAYRAGCRCVYIGEETDLKDLSLEEQPQFLVRNLNEVVPYLEKI